MSLDYLLKFIIIGDSNVGKSCIVQRFMEGHFNGDIGNTIGVEFGAKQIKIKDKNVKLQIWDTAGQETFQSITRSYYRSAAGALLCYDITSKESFEHVQTWLREVQLNGNEKMVICLVGNKADLNEKLVFLFKFLIFIYI
jgi:Ras-related protein Rab-2A